MLFSHICCNKRLFPPRCMKNCTCIWLRGPFVSVAVGVCKPRTPPRASPASREAPRRGHQNTPSPGTPRTPTRAVFKAHPSRTKVALRIRRLFQAPPFKITQWETLWTFRLHGHPHSQLWKSHALDRTPLVPSLPCAFPTWGEVGREGGGAFPRASCESIMLEKHVLIPTLMTPLLPLTSKGLGSHL